MCTVDTCLVTQVVLGFNLIWLILHFSFNEGTWIGPPLPYLMVLQTWMESPLSSGNCILSVERPTFAYYSSWS